MIDSLPGRDPLSDLVSFVQIKIRQKHLWRSATVTKSKIPRRVFSMFFNCVNGIGL